MNLIKSPQMIVVRGSLSKLDFLLDLGLSISDEKPASMNGAIALVSFDRKSQIILKKNQQPNPDSGLVLRTNDCLETYFLLRRRNVKFISEPYYTARGLAARFIDQQGDVYWLLEERNYAEN
ncbi:hypothetical protein GS399_18140 [Pedobacter sp. HMF7647]|uniref:VOC family protein n=1 Tax=Hufsiella arboris TaxID=2695275 RepID=A0A7K1YFM1_9SPHI|nr:hypothetical protein [Hufsiella arboris]MXV52898.1 hypothetical protein [Hufsiella arboris]